MKTKELQKDDKEILKQTKISLMILRCVIRPYGDESLTMKQDKLYCLVKKAIKACESVLTEAGGDKDGTSKNGDNKA